MLTQRSAEKELLDEDMIPAEAFGRMLYEINIINRRLGGHRVTLNGLASFDFSSANKPLHIAEIGCGGGDNLKEIYHWCIKHKIPVRLTGIDIRPECIEYARQHITGIPINYIVSDYKLVYFEDTPDIIFNALFCHHFSSDDIVYMLGWMKQNSRMGFFINDLHRNAIAYYSIKLLTRLFGKSYMVKYDAPLSVKRGFRKGEWLQLVKSAGLEGTTVQWQFAFRHLLVYHAR